MNSVSIVGVLCGLWAAFFQSLSYLATRHFVHVRSPAGGGTGGGSQMLLVLAHVLMGGASAAVLPFVLPADGIPWARIALPLFVTAFFYALGQLGMMVALRHAQPSQVAPMLALKLLVLAFLMITVRHERIYFLQWFAIGCCVAGTFVLNYSRDRLPRAALYAVLPTCVVFAISDWGITYLLPAFGEGMPHWQKVANASLLCYLLCGIAAVPFLPFFGSRKVADWSGAVPFSAVWMLAMLGLFTCFALVGVVYGNILQSTRSIMGVFLAALLTHLGITHIEHLRNRAMFARRMVAAVLMTAAAVLWFEGKPSSATTSTSGPAAAPAPPAATSPSASE